MTKLEIKDKGLKELLKIKNKLNILTDGKGKAEKMKAKTRFLKMYYKLPKQARMELVYNYSSSPMSLEVVMIEVINNTKLGDKILKELGYEEK